jgi:O-antigen/teichoic acid export membrane protein
LSAQGFIFWAVLSIPFKGLVWVLGFVLLAKGDNKLFLIVEVTSNMLLLGFNLLFYKIYGINGLGISILISYSIFIIVMLTILKQKYAFIFSNDVFILLTKGMISLSLCLISIYCLGYPKAYFAESIVVIITISYCMFELNKRMNIKEIILNLKSKFIS